LSPLSFFLLRPSQQQQQLQQQRQLQRQSGVLQWMLSGEEAWEEMGVRDWGMAYVGDPLKKHFTVKVYSRPRPPLFFKTF
jgi:hypothetical protein